MVLPKTESGVVEADNLLPGVRGKRDSYNVASAYSSSVIQLIRAEPSEQSEGQGEKETVTMWLVPTTGHWHTLTTRVKDRQQSPQGSL